MEHLYTCKWDQNNNEIKYENILGDNIKKKDEESVQSIQSKI